MDFKLMRIPPRRTTAQTRAAAPLTDAAGHVWNDSLYQKLKSGEPRLTSKGLFWLEPGKKHAK
jgi:hypothetical protein